MTVACFCGATFDCDTLGVCPTCGEPADTPTVAEALLTEIAPLPEVVVDCD